MLRYKVQNKKSEEQWWRECGASTSKCSFLAALQNLTGNLAKIFKNITIEIRKFEFFLKDIGPRFPSIWQTLGWKIQAALHPRTTRAMDYSFQSRLFKHVDSSNCRIDWGPVSKLCKTNFSKKLKINQNYLWQRTPWNQETCRSRGHDPCHKNPSKW